MSCAHCTRELCMLCMCVVQARVWRCVRYTVLDVLLVLWRVEVYGRWCCGTDLLFASVIATCFCFRLVFGLFCVVCVVSVYIGFFVGFGCFWFGASMGGRYRETASCAILQIVLPTGSLLLLSSFSVVCLKFRIRCSFSVCV